MMESQNQVKNDNSEAAGIGNSEAEEKIEETAKVEVIYKFCDLQQKLVDAWNEQFKDYIPDRVQVYKGDIFREGPAADAIVSPANSFGFMDGGIDMAYSRHFGWQMQDRLQEVIREQYDGELLVGQAAIITTVEQHNRNTVDWSQYNEGQPIKYLISAPTMRVPDDVSDTINAYLAFRAIILAVQKFNATKPEEPIRSVLCPGLGTAVGLMPRDRCAYQMLKAFEDFDLRIDQQVLHPRNLSFPLNHFYDMVEFGGKDTKQGPPKDKHVVKTSNKATKSKQAVKNVKKQGTSECSQKGQESTGTLNTLASAEKVPESTGTQKTPASAEKGPESTGFQTTGSAEKGPSNRDNQEPDLSVEKQEPAKEETV